MWLGLSALEKDQLAKLRFVASGLANEDFFNKDVSLDPDLVAAVDWVAQRSPQQVIASFAFLVRAAVFSVVLSGNTGT